MGHPPSDFVHTRQHRDRRKYYLFIVDYLLYKVNQVVCKKLKPLYLLLNQANFQQNFSP